MIMLKMPCNINMWHKTNRGSQRLVAEGITNVSVPHGIVNQTIATQRQLPCSKSVSRSTCCKALSLTLKETFVTIWGLVLCQTLLMLNSCCMADASSIRSLNWNAFNKLICWETSVKRKVTNFNWFIFQSKRFKTLWKNSWTNILLNL